MAKRYWPPAIPSFTAGSVKNCWKNRSVSPFDLLGMSTTFTNPLMSTKMMFTSSPGTTHGVLSLGSQGSGSVQDVFSFRMREQINLQIFFLVLKKRHQSCWCRGSPRLMIPQKASLVLQRTNCYVFMGERCLDWFPKMRFLPWLLTVKVQLFSLPSHSSPV